MGVALAWWWPWRERSLPGNGRGGSHGIVNPAVPFFSTAPVSGSFYAGAPAMGFVVAIGLDFLLLGVVVAILKKYFEKCCVYYI